MKGLLPVITIIILDFVLFFNAEAQTNQIVISGTPTNPVHFTGAGCTFNWVNNTPGIGLPVKGSGDISSFTAINTSNSPVVATITETPVPTGYAYISNTATNIISVINTANNTLVDTIAVGSAPYGLAVSPDGAHVYVANSGSGTVSVINTATNILQATILTGSVPSGIAVSPDGSRVYVTNTNDNTVTVIGTAINAVVTTIQVGANPYGIAVSSDGSIVYVTNRLSNTVSVINASSNQVITTIPVGTEPEAICISPDGGRVYIANSASASISVISTSANTVTATCQLSGINPVGMCISPDGSSLYVANFGSNNISVVNTATNTEISAFSEGLGPVSVLMSPDGSVLYVVNNVTGTFSLINTSSDTPISAVSVGVGSAGSLGSNFISFGQGCTSSPVTFTITVNPNVPSSVTINASSINICAGDPVTFTAVPSNGGNAPAYQWVVNGNDSGSNSSTFTSNALNNGDSVYCIMTSSVANTSPVPSVALYMTVNPPPTVAFSPDTVFITVDKAAQLAPLVTGSISQYQWSPPDGLSKTDTAGPFATPSKNTIYQLTVTTDKGCTSTGTVAVIFAQPLEMPGAFTPNHDGKNDVFRILPGAQLVLQEFDVFDRWGHLVFFTHDISKGWDGSYNGAIAGAGTYIYVVRGKTPAGKQVLLKGTVVLIR